jgi:hypothetical protein
MRNEVACVTYTVRLSILVWLLPNLVCFATYFKQNSYLILLFFFVDLAPALTEASGPGLVGGQTGKFTYLTLIFSCFYLTTFSFFHSQDISMCSLATKKGGWCVKVALKYLSKSLMVSP